MPARPPRRDQRAGWPGRAGAAAYAGARRPPPSAPPSGARSPREAVASSAPRQVARGTRRRRAGEPRPTRPGWGRRRRRGRRSRVCGVQVPGAHSRASRSSCRARLMRLLTVPLGMPSSVAASRVLRPSRTVAWTTARSSGESRRRAVPDVAVLDPGEHLLLGGDGRVAAQADQALDDVATRAELWSRQRIAMPHSQAATSPSPRHDAGLRQTARKVSWSASSTTAGSAQRRDEPQREPRLVAAEELVQCAAVASPDGAHQLGVGAVVRPPSRPGPGVPSRTSVTPRPRNGSASPREEVPDVFPARATGPVEPAATSTSAAQAGVRARSRRAPRSEEVP